MSTTERIYITGMMGSGKSTLGPRVAEALSRTFIDLDNWIEVQNGRSIADLFAYLGEEAFREIESAALIEVSAERNAVIALGGGTLIRMENQETVLRTGVLVYLSLSEDALFRRLTRVNRSRRPLLAGETTDGGSGTISQSYIDELLNMRLPGYARAHVAIDIDDCSKREAVERTIKAISYFLESQGSL